MKNKKQIIEIDRLATELTGKLVKLLKDNNLSARQDKAAATAYHGLLFWRRTEFEEMKKEFKLPAADGRAPAERNRRKES